MKYILDGGMGRELERVGAPFRQPEWSALALMETPHLVRQVHEEFIKGGAQVIITSCYAVVPFHLGQERFDKQGRELIALAAKLAREAADGANINVKVAGSIPPLFGSYNHKDFDAELAPEMFKIFIEEQAPYVDLWLAETMCSRKEAEAVQKAIDESGSKAPLWLSFSLSEERPLQLRSGELMEDTVRFAQESTSAEALLYNCCAIEDIEDAVKQTHALLSDERKLMIGVYPNAFQRSSETHKANEKLNEIRSDVTPEHFSDYAQKWSEAGADIVGGCCGISPDHIAAIKH